jgi:hypothetical protein
VTPVKMLFLWFLLLAGDGGVVIVLPLVAVVHMRRRGKEGREGGRGSSPPSLLPSCLTTTFLSALLPCI